jgi:hypothetical protein
MSPGRSPNGPQFSRRQIRAPHFDLATLAALGVYREAVRKQADADRAFRLAQASIDHVKAERAGITARAAMAETIAARAALDACLLDA